MFEALRSTGLFAAEQELLSNEQAQDTDGKFFVQLRGKSFNK
jgi:hypothetical protein